MFGVRWAALWPCPKGATIYRDSNRVGETAEQQVKRQVPGLTATERSVCCGAWTGHKCRSDGRCLNCETGSRPTWEHMLVCTQLNFDMIDFSEIPQAYVDEVRKTVETDTFAACAMMPKSYRTPPRETLVEHEARLMAVRIFAKEASRKGIEYRQRCRELTLEKLFRQACALVRSFCFLFLTAVTKPSSSASRFRRYSPHADGVPAGVQGFHAPFCRPLYRLWTGGAASLRRGQRPSMTSDLKVLEPILPPISEAWPWLWLPRFVVL